MIIAVDGNEANEKDPVGVHQYALELLWALYKLQDTNYHYIIYLKNTPKSVLPPERPGWNYKIIAGNTLWVFTKLLPSLWMTGNIDVFFSPTHYLPVFLTKPQVFTLHDLGYLKFSEQFKKYDFWQLKIWTAISIIVSKYIICPSKYTAKDIVRHYSFARNKTNVIHLAYDKTKFHPNINHNFVRRVINKYRISNDYLLFLSTLKPSKNVEGLLDAFAYIIEENNKNNNNIIKNVKLVIAGKKGWMYEPIFEKIKSLGLKKRVIFTDYIDEEDKPALVKGAKGLILPSFWEGFGMDLLNSMACGTPVIASKVASIPEIAGNAAIYVNPYDIKSIASGMEKLLMMNPLEYNNIVKKGFNQVQKFSWDLAARKTLKILQDAAKK